MRRKVRNKLQFLSLIPIYLSATVLLINWQGQAFASEEKKLDGLFEIKHPKLPPLGEPSAYLPEERNFQYHQSIGVRLVIKLSDRRVYVYQADRLQTSYPIAVGKEGWETPTGSFQIIQMLRNPTWEHPWTGEIVPPGPNNPLGDRWIGFWTDGRNYIGFHGTTSEELIGQAVSHGCVRMRNKDVRELFKKVTIGTTVTVEP